MSALLQIEEWVSASKAGRVLGCPGRQVARLAETLGIRVRRLPGCQDRFSLADILKLAEASTAPNPAK